MRDHVLLMLFFENDDPGRLEIMAGWKTASVSIEKGGTGFEIRARSAIVSSEMFPPPCFGRARDAFFPFPVPGGRFPEKLS